MNAPAQSTALPEANRITTDEGDLNKEKTGDGEIPAWTKALLIRLEKLEGKTTDGDPDPGSMATDEDEEENRKVTGDAAFKHNLIADAEIFCPGFQPAGDKSLKRQVLNHALRTGDSLKSFGVSDFYKVPKAMVDAVFTAAVAQHKAKSHLALLNSGTHTTDPSLSDETYRIILKAKIAINNWVGRNDSLPPILDVATTGSGLKTQIVDNQDMTISVWGFPETDISDVFLELIAAIKPSYLTVKAAGVWAGDVDTHSVEAPSEGSKFFGFDMDRWVRCWIMGDNTLMAISNFKPFATVANTNVTTQAEREALPVLLSGFTAGKASRAQVNKAIRQASFITAVLAQYTANKSGLDMLDDGDLNGFNSKIGSAFGKDFQALDATLTALAGLATGADKLPYFTGADTVAQTNLTSVGRDIIGKKYYC